MIHEGRKDGRTDSNLEMKERPSCCLLQSAAVVQRCWDADEGKEGDGGKTEERRWRKGGGGRKMEVGS